MIFTLDNYKFELKATKDTIEIYCCNTDFMGIAYKKDGKDEYQIDIPCGPLLNVKVSRLAPHKGNKTIYTISQTIERKLCICDE